MSPIGTQVGMRMAPRTIYYVTDFDEALRFYTDVIGLEPAYPPVEKHWAEFKMDAGSFCLHAGRAENAPPRGIASYGWPVDDVDAAYAKLKESGVDTDEIQPVTEGVRCVEFRDPSGNQLYFEGA